MKLMLEKSVENSKSVRDLQKSLSRSLWTLYFLSFCGDFLFNGITFVASLVAASLGASDEAIGLVTASYGISYCILPLIMGKLSDKIGRKKSITLCFLTFVITALIFMFATEIWHLILGGIMEGLALSFLWPAASSVIKEMSSPRTSKANLNRYFISWGLGAIFGPLLASIVYEISGEIVFFVMLVILCLLCIVLILKFFRITEYPEELLEYENSRSLNSDESSSEIEEPFKIPPQSKVFYFIFTFTIVLFSGIYFIIVTGYYAGYLAKYSNLSPFTIGLIIFCMPLGRIIALILVKYISTPQKLLLMPVCAIITIPLIYFLYAVTPTLLLMPVFIALGVISGFGFGGGVALINELAVEKKGLYNGIAESLIGLDFVVTPILPFILFGKGANSPFYFVQVAAAAFFVSMIICIIMIRVKKK